PERQNHPFASIQRPIACLGMVLLTDGFTANKVRRFRQTIARCDTLGRRSMVTVSAVVESESQLGKLLLHLFQSSLYGDQVGEVKDQLGSHGQGAICIFGA